MVDSWKTFALALLTGTLAVPMRAWPAERTWIVVAPWPQEPDLERPSDPADPEPLSEADVPIVEHVVDAGATSVREAATALCMPRQRVWRGLHRLQAQGLVRLQHDGWTNA